MGADATTVSIDMPAVRTGQEYFFTAVPMDVWATWTLLLR